MFKKILYVVLSLSFINVYAVVPTTDVGPSGIKASKDMASDGATMAGYIASVTTTIGKIGKAMTVADQVQKLQGLQKLNTTASLCQLCTKTDKAQLLEYANNINDDLCSQFSSAYQNATGIKKAAESLSDIMKLLQTNPAAAMISLQQASMAAQQTTNNTLAQMQVLQTQAFQKQLTQEKIQKQTAQDVGKGFTDFKL